MALTDPSLLSDSLVLTGADTGVRRSITIPYLLQKALDKACQAETFIGPEIARLERLLAEAENDTERDSRLYQIEYVEGYLKRAANLARYRLEYIRSIDTEQKIEEELEKCRTDKHHWFRTYGWGYDPRARTPLSVVPFELFPKQAEMVDWLDDLVFFKRRSGIIEKSRDEGATELMVRWGIHNWRFQPGFSMLLSSRTEDEVDTKKRRGTLFERMRYQLRLLPDWMLPEGFDLKRDLLADKLIANPENGNELFGQAPVENMGRGDRVTCAMFDEFAFWRFGGYPQYESMSQTTDSVLMPSSVAGRLNQYADIAFDGVTPKFTLDWRENPFKDKRWYDSLPFGYISPKMRATTIAQEVDRNYEASQPGKVWFVPEPLVFIDRNDFLRPFLAAGLGYKFFDNGDPVTGRFQIPSDWETTRYSDYGKSPGHDWAYTLAARPTENYPVFDTMFVFVSRNLEPNGLATEQAVSQWREFEAEYGRPFLPSEPETNRKRFFASWCSHEQKELRGVLLNKYGELWNAWGTDYDRGIERIEDWWTPIDKLKQNPFRPELMGRSRLVFVAPPGEYQLAFNERLEQWFVTMSASEAGFLTARKQLSAYHYPLEELGKPKKLQRPVKEFDDIVDTIRAIAVMYGVKPQKATAKERFEKRIKDHMPHLAAEAIAEHADRAKQSHLLAARQMEQAVFDQEERVALIPEDDFIRFMHDLENQ